MLPFADVLCALAGVLLLVMTLPGRSMRGEAFVGAHLVTGPMALAFTLGAVAVQFAAPLPFAWANALLALCWPGVVVGLTFLPLAAYGGRRAPLVKTVMPVVVAAPFLLGHGGAWHAAVPWFGAGALASVGLGGTWVLLEQPLRRWRMRLGRALSASPPEPSAWEREQAEWQRGEWRKVPVAAGVATLLQHARSLAPEVRAACHERLVAHPDLDAALAAELRGPQPAEALWYIAHHYPRSRQVFAAPIRELLASLRATWPERLRADTHERPWTGDLMPALECAVAVLVAGGDVRAELRAWQQELASLPKFRGMAQELARWLAKQG